MKDERRKDEMKMVELKPVESKYLEDYDIHVNHYLTYAQIQTIVEGVKKMSTWAERNVNIDMMLLLFVTDIPREQLEILGDEVIITSGLMEAVRREVYNLYRVYEAVEWTESIGRGVQEIATYLNQVVSKIDTTALLNKVKEVKK